MLFGDDVITGSTQETETDAPATETEAPEQVLETEMPAETYTGGSSDGIDAQMPAETEMLVETDGYSDTDSEIPEFDTEASARDRSSRRDRRLPQRPKLLQKRRCPPSRSTRSTI